MKIIDKNTGKLFDIPADFKISIDKSNPFLTTQGTVSLPITFPWTENNAEFLDHPHRFDRATKLLANRSVIIQVGILQREATLSITDAQRPSSISSGYIIGTFLFDEALFYNVMKNVTLRSIFSTVIRRDMVQTELTDRRLAWVNYLEKVMTGSVSDDFYVFPVCYEVDGTGIATTSKNSFLNHISSMNVDTTGTPYYHLSGISARAFTIDSASVAIPIGYGITPFLKLSKVLSFIFQYYGFNLNDDYLDKYPELKKLVVLNNTADALMLGVLNYGQLVPTKTITEFLDSVRYKFGCEFFTAENGVDISIVFWNDVLDSSDLSLDRIIQAQPIVRVEGRKALKLSSSYTNKSKSNYSSFKAMSTSFGTLPITYSEGFPSYSAHPETFFEQIVFVQKNLRFYHMYSYITYKGFIDYKYDKLGDDLYDYFADDNSEAKEYTSPDEAVPMVLVDLGATKDITAIWSTESRTQAFLIPYIGNVVNINGAITVDNQTSSDSSTDCPIMFCFHFGRRVSDVSPNDGKIFWGTTHRYDDSGIPWGNFNLVYNGKNGLYETFWKKYDKVLNDSFQPISVPTNLSFYQALNYNPAKLKSLFGQPLLAESMKYDITDERVTVSEAIFRTVKPYQSKVYNINWTDFVCELGGAPDPTLPNNLATPTIVPYGPHGATPHYYLTITLQYEATTSLSVEVLTDFGLYTVPVNAGDIGGKITIAGNPNTVKIVGITPSKDTTYNYTFN